MPLSLTFHTQTLTAVEWGSFFLFLPVEEKQEEFKLNKSFCTRFWVVTYYRTYDYYGFSGHLSLYLCRKRNIWSLKTEGKF